MTTIEVKTAGNLRCEAVHLASANTLVTDAPTDNHGLGESFSPTDLLATALLTCMTTIMDIQASKMRKALSAQGVVHKHMASDPRRVARLELEITVDGTPFSEPQRELLEKAAKNCPVALSLSGELEQQVNFRWT